MENDIWNEISSFLNQLRCENINRESYIYFQELANIQLKKKMEKEKVNKLLDHISNEDREKLKQYGEILEENFAKYRELMRSFKSKVNQCASLITSNVRAANTIYPRTMHEYETRRDYQNAAIVNCEQLINELQRVVEIFDVDLNVYNRYVKAIDREIGLIKRWRQRDMAIKSRLEKG